MDRHKYDRSISLRCSTCANTSFEHSSDGGSLRCVSCDRVFTREELIRENGATIEAEADAVKGEVLTDFRDEFRNMMRNAFRGSKSIKFE